MKSFILILIIIFSNTVWSQSVLVVDTGIDTTHSFLREYKIKQDILDTPEKDHGTHLACILVKGLNKDSINIHSINYEKKSIPEILKAIHNKKYDYVLYSIGGVLSQNKEKVIFEKIIRNNENVKIITSAGNNSKNLDIEPYYPCSYDINNIVCIGNYEKYSNYGRKVTKIKSPKIFESCSFNNSFKKMQGTSQSSSYYLNNLILKY